MTTIEQEVGPPRVDLPENETVEVPNRDATRPRCRANLFDEEGKPVGCHYQSAMTWYGIPFCGNHAPPRRPGAAGWNRI
jgi:hypothetical protein